MIPRRISGDNVFTKLAVIAKVCTGSLMSNYFPNDSSRRESVGNPSITNAENMICACLAYNNPYFAGGINSIPTLNSEQYAAPVFDNRSTFFNANQEQIVALYNQFITLMRTVNTSMTQTYVSLP